MKKNFIKILPFIISISVGILFLIIGLLPKNEYISSLLNNIAASFLAIPLVYVFYQSIENFSKRELSKQVRKYCKMQIDGEVLSIANHISKIVFPLKNVRYEKGILALLNIEKDEIIDTVKSGKYLGFQVFKHWEISKKYIEKSLENPLLLKFFDDDVIECIVSMLTNMYNLMRLLENKNLYIETNDKTDEYILVKGTDFNEENKILPDRFLLLKPIDNGRSVVVDFGDFHKFNIDNCLKLYIVNEKFVNNFASVIYSLLQDFKKWGNLTGGKIILID